MAADPDVDKLIPLALKSLRRSGIEFFTTDGVAEIMARFAVDLLRRQREALDAEGMDDIARLLVEASERRLMTTAQVAYVFRVSAHTVTNWVNAGKLTSVTPAGSTHFRFRVQDVEALLRKAS